jgi:hypothetical protein
MRTGRNAAVFLVLLWLLLALAALSYAGEIPPSPYWKNEIVFPDEPFLASGTFASDPGWVKFTILLDPYDPNVVYFQDSKRYAFHYNFAVELLTPFIGMTHRQFDEATLYEEDQQAVLGAVIMPPNAGWPEPFPYPEYGIQFVRHDPYTKEEVAELFNIVKSGVQADPSVQAFYFPAYEQIGTAEANREWFESQGIPIGSASRWAPGNACYSSGWAFGKLKYFDGDDIQAAYLAGLLEPNDILLTNGVPAEVPFVAGIISLSPSTPNSHVAILAKTFGVPFVHLALAEDAERAWELVGHRIVLCAFEEWYELDIRLIDVEGVLDEQTIEEILALKEPPALEISPMADYGAYSASTDGLLPRDTKYFGGKAANFGILRAAIPDNCPVAAAFSFRLWKEFLDQQLVTHKTLREEINSRLADYTYPPSDMAALADDLSYIRDMFRDRYFTSFTHSEENAVISILQDPRYGFDANRNIRFRSSTNVEDCNYFTGAGLYDSFSGCLADDLDGNESGPCICDANETGERGVFRAIRKVFASFYNDNAFLERLRYGVNEADVGMALLVHHSTPDEFELANGVATAEKWYGSDWEIKLVTQLGAVSVANPQDGSIPEEVDVYYSSYGIYPTLARGSNLVPLGATVLDWQDEYIELARLLAAAAQQFEKLTGKMKYTLDFEYKKVAPEGKLIVKQVREIPQPDNTRSITPFLINEPVEYCTFQGEYGDVFANHRLKSCWRFETKNMWLTKEDLARCLYTNVELEYADSGRVRSVSGKLSEWPFASHKTQQGGYEHQVDTIDGWLMHHLQNRRGCQLYSEWIPTLVSRAENPMLTLEDFQWLTLHVEYDEPVVTIDGTGPTTTTTESIRLCPCPQPQQGDLLQQRSAKLGGRGGVSISTSFYWPPTPAGPIAGYTAPLVRWVETVITGYTTQPIVLHGWYSQTYRPQHHNFSEDFIFEPQLEPGLSTGLLAELRAKDIRFIYLQVGFGDPIIRIYGFDEKPFLPADLDDDKDVDLRDLALFGAHWGNRLCNECGGADLTGDGCVSACDLWELGESWLAQGPVGATIE